MMKFWISLVDSILESPREPLSETRIEKILLEKDEVSVRPQPQPRAKTIRRKKPKDETPYPFSEKNLKVRIFTIHWLMIKALSNKLQGEEITKIVIDVNLNFSKGLPFKEYTKKVVIFLNSS